MLRSSVGVAALLLAVIPVPAAGAENTENTGSIAGVRFWDRNNDGVHQTEEPGAPAHLVYLEKPSGERVAEAQISDNGNYIMTDIAPGDYIVVFPLNREYYLDSTPRRAQVTVTADQRALVDYGVRGGELSGMAWKDLNGDGQRQQGEPPLAGVRVELGLPAPIGYTNKDGTYHFHDLPVMQDVYGPTFEVRPGMSFSPPLVGKEATDSDVIDADEGKADAKITTFRGIIYDALNTDAGYVPNAR